jgi:hypothetical protein
MVTTIFTIDNNMYRLSNDAFDNADNYIASKYVLFIFPLGFKTHSIGYNDAIITIPYVLINNVIYHDEYGKALADYIWYKKGVGSPSLPPPDPPSPMYYDMLKRHKSLIGDHILSESCVV